MPATPLPLRSALTLSLSLLASRPALAQIPDPFRIGAQREDVEGERRECLSLAEPGRRQERDRRLLERPAVWATLSSGATLLHTSRGSYETLASAYGYGVGTNATLEAEVMAAHPFWGRINTAFVLTGRLGAQGELALGYAFRRYGPAFTPAGWTTFRTQWGRGFASWPNLCTLERFDFRLYSGARWGAFAGRDGATIASGPYRVPQPAEGWLAPQVGLSFRWTRERGSSVDIALAGMFDVLNGGSGGLYHRLYVTLRHFLLGAEVGFLLPLDRSMTSTRTPWDLWWFTANLGGAFEL